MARITGFEPDPHRPGAVRVLVDGRPFCTVHEGAADAGLRVGGEWDDRQQAVAGQAADEEAAWRAALRSLEFRSFAVAELRRRLRLKGHPPAAVDYAVGRAQGAGLLDDAAYARQYVASRAARGRGPSRIRRDLQALGVSREVIDPALAEQWPDQDDALVIARELAERRLRQLAALPVETRRRRVLAYLARRGFTGGRVSDIVARALRGKS